MAKKHHIPQPADWRYRLATTLVEDFTSPWTGRLYKKDTPVTLPIFVEFLKKKLEIGDPSSPALFLSQSHKSFEQAMQIHPFVKGWPPRRGTDPSVLAYDYLEAMMTSVVFAYSAIEAYANQTIPETYTYNAELDSGLFVAHDKEWIERYLNLDVKLIDVLPSILEKPSPKSLAIWEGYHHLRDLRNAIVHLKTVSYPASQEVNASPDSIWYRLLSPQQRNYPLDAKKLILHFADRETTHWLKYCPF